MTPVLGTARDPLSGLYRGRQLLNSEPDAYLVPRIGQDRSGNTIPAHERDSTEEDLGPPENIYLDHPPSVVPRSLRPVYYSTEPSGIQNPEVRTLESDPSILETPADALPPNRDPYRIPSETTRLFADHLGRVEQEESEEHSDANLPTPSGAISQRASSGDIRRMNAVK